MSESKNKLKHYDESNPLSHFYEFGMSPNDIKAGIIDSFSQYFQNPEQLEKLAISDIVNSWLGYLSIYRDDPDLLDFMDSILEIFNGAKQISQEHVFSIYAEWLPDISQSISKFWSLHNSQINHKDLCFEDFAEYSFRIIGQSIEGLAKPILMLLLHLNRVKRSKPHSFEEIKSRDLGVVIDELINTTSLSDFLTINSIRLNQWRNIAYHHNYKFVNQKLICWYKKGDRIEEFEMSKEVLELSTKKIARIFSLLRISETIFAFDNLSDIQKATNQIENPSINVREEANLIDLYSSIGTQGFKLLNLIQEDSISATLSLQDMKLYGNAIERSIHSSQFLYSLWLHTGAHKLEVIYHQSNGEKFSSFSLNIDAIKSLTTNSISEFLKTVQIQRHIKNTQDSDPFFGMFIPKPLRSLSFFSQKGEKITTKEFVRQFTLSTFCNYLVLDSEESTESIKTNVGSDGALSISEGSSGKFVFHVPAQIESRELQKIIIKMLDRTISLYKEFRLKSEIVESALNNNRYYQKKASIREQTIVNKSNN